MMAVFSVDDFSPAALDQLRLVVRGGQPINQAQQLSTNVETLVDLLALLADPQRAKAQLEELRVLAQEAREEIEQLGKERDALSEERDAVAHERADADDIFKNNAAIAKEINNRRLSVEAREAELIQARREFDQQHVDLMQRFTAVRAAEVKSELVLVDLSRRASELDQRETELVGRERELGGKIQNFMKSISGAKE